MDNEYLKEIEDIKIILIYLRAILKVCARAVDVFLSDDDNKLWQLYSTTCRPNLLAT